MPASTIDWDQVADLYDAYVQADFDIPFWLDEAKQANGEVLELMCGTGRVSLPLARRGVRLTCVDLSHEMLARLEAKLALEHLSAEVHQMDVRELSLARRFSLTLLPFNSFGEILSAEERLEALKRIHHQTEDGGRVIVTLHNPPVRLQGRFDRLELVGSYPCAKGQLLFWTWQSHDAERKQIAGFQFYEIYDAAGMQVSRRMLGIRFVLIGPGEFKEASDAAGFRVEAIYGNYERAPFDEDKSPYQIWVLKKE